MAKRVLFLEHNTDGTIGGSHYCLLEICRGLDRRRYEPVVWFYQANTLLDEFRAVAEVVVQALPEPVHLSGEKRARRWLAPFQSLLNLHRTLVTRSSLWAAHLRRLRIDLVHLNNSAGSDHDLLVAALRCGLPCIAHQRGYPAHPTALHRLLARRFDTIISISNEVTHNIRSKGFPMRRVELVPDGIDPRRIESQAAPEAVRRKLGIPPQAPLVGVVGNVKGWKGQLTLVSAMRRIVTRFPDARCVLVGSIADQPYHEKLQREIAEGDLGRCVIFTGYEKNPAAVMSAMDVVVHTSVAPEPFGIVILEAMALGKPVVATAHGGPLDIITHGVDGLLTSPGDAEQLATELCALLADPPRREALGRSGRETLLKRFTAQVNADRVQEIFDRALARRA